MDAMLDTQTNDNNLPLDLNIPNKKSPIGKSQAGIERAARMRAAIIALLNNSSEPLAKGEIQAKLDDVIKELKYKPSNFESHLYGLVGNELVKKIPKTPPGTGYLYASPKFEFPNSGGDNIQEEPRQKRTYVKKKGLENSNSMTSSISASTGVGKIPSVSLDIVKSTGRVRLAINGMSIEIGVSDN
jgi:hypothetical protein